MSRERSIPEMNYNELCVKLAFDRYRLGLLEEYKEKGLFSPFQEEGFDGLDEFLYVGKFKLTGQLNRRIKYFQKQVSMTERYLGLRPGDDISGELERIARESDELDDEIKCLALHDYNPATISVLGRVRETERRKRLVRMIDEGSYTVNDLHPDEAVRYVKEKVSNFVEGVADAFGAAGRLVLRSAVPVVALSLILGTAVGGIQTLRTSYIYNNASQAYSQCSRFGGIPHYLKRDVPNAIEKMEPDLYDTYSCDDDGCSGSRSDPQAASRSAHALYDTIEGMVSDSLVETWDLVPEDIKSVIEDIDAGQLDILKAANTLGGKHSTYDDYDTEDGWLHAGSSKIRQAVTILEKYMDPEIVDDENNAYGEHQRWKTLTEIFGVTTLVLCTVIAKALDEDRLSRKYYR